MDAKRARETIATSAPRRLRIDELLRSLGATDRKSADGKEPKIGKDGVSVDHADHPDGAPAPAPAPAPASAPAAGTQPANARREKLTVGELVDVAAEAGFAFLIGVLSLIAIPFFGLSTPFGLAIALVGAQMMTGRKAPWLPQRARRRALSMSMLDRVVGLLARRAKWLVKATRPRGSGWIQPKVIGFGIVLLSLGLALPLPIPGSNLVFLVPLFIYSVAVLERDGLWVVIGHICVLVDVALLFVFGATVVTVLQKIWAWVS